MTICLKEREDISKMLLACAAGAEVLLTNSHALKFEVLADHLAADLQQQFAEAK